MAAGAKKPMPQYENTSKAKVKADKMAADIAGYFGYGTKATPKAQQPMKVTNSSIAKGEAEFMKQLKQGKTFGEARKYIMKKYGFSPNGMTD